MPQNKLKLLYLIPVIFFSILLWRIFQGVEFTDEAQYVSWTLLLVRGQGLFSTDLFMQQLAAIWTAPWLYIWTYFFDDDFIFLIHRIIFLFYILCAFVLIFKILIKKTHFLSAVLSASWVIVFIPFSLYAVTYNTIAVIIILIFSVSVFHSSSMWSKTSCFTLATLGAIGPIFYPTLAVPVFLLSLPFFYTAKNRIYFACGAFFVIALSGLGLVYIGPEKFKQIYLFTASFGALKSTKEVLDILADLFFLNYTWGKLFWLGSIFYFSGLSYLKKYEWFAHAIWLTGAVIACSVLSSRHAFNPAHYFLISFSTVTLPQIIYLYVKNVPTHRNFCKGYYIYFVLYLCSIVTAATSSNGLPNAVLVSVAAILMYFLLMVRTTLHRYILSLCHFTMLCMCLYLTTTYVYREGPLKNLTNQITAGPYRGLYTHLTNYQVINELNKIMEFIPANSKITSLHANAAPYSWPKIIPQTRFLYFFCDRLTEPLQQYVIDPMLNKSTAVDFLLLYLPDRAHISEGCKTEFITNFINSHSLIEFYKSAYWIVFRSKKLGNL